ncbi:MAG: hypothetical protein EU547_06945, partial [Promethearchaeota archaeon]
MTLQKTNNFCSNCILPDGFLGIRLDEHGICDICRDPTFQTENWRKVQITEKMRIDALKDWNSTIEKINTSENRIPYDCILGYSGGKDSTALLDMLINELNLNVLAVTIDTGFMTDVAKENIENTLKNLNYSTHHRFITKAAPTFIRLYKNLFLTHNSNKRILAGTLCDHCSDLIHSILLKEAIQREIPIIILGYSSDQIKRYFYEIPQKEMLTEWTPDFLFPNQFTKRDQKWFLSEIERELSDLPRFLLPYHVLEYNEKKIINKIISKELIERGNSDPVLTNCHVVKAALMYDLYRYGGISYALQYAELVRQEKEEKRPRTRKKWLFLCISVGKAILSGRFAKEGIDYFLSEIGISRKDFLSKINSELELDPN